MPKHKQKGPLSLLGAAQRLRPGASLVLRVVQRAAPPHGLPAGVHPSTLAQLLEPGSSAELPASMFLQLASGSDCVLHVRPCADVAPGTITVDEVQQANLRLCSGADVAFSAFLPGSNELIDLTDLDAEVRLLHPRDGGSDGGGVQVDARALTQAFGKQCFGRMLAVNEFVAVELPGVPVLLLRVTATNTLTADEQLDAVGYHCFRGLLTPDTQVYLVQQPAAGAAASAEGQQQQQPTVALLNARRRPPAGAPTHVVHMLTCDGEVFMPTKKLLRPCIALTAAVRDAGDAAPSVEVPIDTATLDRVLIYLEALALGRDPPHFAVHLLPELQDAAEHLGLRALQEHCKQLLEGKAARLQVYSFADVQRANASGKVWLILDGMVLDVGRWLPEHPGGSTIIPSQALGVECARMFELYHASKESFIYLREFYIGELHPQERPLVPSGRQPPSPEFLAQLREHTSWRQVPADAAAPAFKSF